MKHIATNALMALMLLALFGAETLAQETESQINIKITRDINGEEKTYEGSYETEEQMQADEALKEFMGDEDMKTNFWFGSPRNGNVAIEEDEDESRYMFRFDEEQGPFHFKIFQDDSTMEAFHLQMEEMMENFEGMDDEMKEKIKELKEKNDHTFAFTVPDIDYDFDWTMPDSLAKQVEVLVRKIQDQHSGMEKRIEIRVSKTLKITEEVGDDFGKKGVVKENNTLVIPDLGYFPNPAPNGTFKLRFNTPGAGELSIKIFNLDGKEVFNRYFENYLGLYSETIDLSRQSEGMYMLEIQQDGKRLTRKIVIN